MTAQMPINTSSHQTYTAILDGQSNDKATHPWLIHSVLAYGYLQESITL